MSLLGSLLWRRPVRAVADVLTAAGRAPRDSERASLPEVSERLDSLRERLQELPGRAAALPLAELAALIAVAAAPGDTAALAAALRDEGVLVLLADEDREEMTRRLLCAGVRDLEQRVVGRLVLTTGRARRPHLPG